ncbi:MAG: DUF2089 domain-containing protein, partial [Chitinispirillaceae bacterium]|nr:DUF2089 domain-containing protein [Chitinispirillaceae bacterium]
MSHEWHKLSQMVNDQEIIVTRVTSPKSRITIEGEFNLPPLAKLPYEDQVFAGMFIKVHGSIKEMEQAFGISYPTVKARLNRISRSLGFVETKEVSDKEEILSKLERGDISADEAIKELT